MPADFTTMDNNNNNNKHYTPGSGQDAPMTDYPATEANFPVSEFFELDDWIDEDPAFLLSSNPPNPSYTANEQLNSTGIEHEGDSSTSGRGRGKKVAFKTKSEVEILDDGFKWRKYGKKMVKNSPNPRNYYKCSVEGCPVKKRVERDKEDPRYVVTTYEGIHNHQRPHL